MASRQISFLRSCFRLPGLKDKQAKLTANDFSESEEFLFFFLKQVSWLNIPGIRFEPIQYHSVGRWGFTALVSVNGNKELLLFAQKEQDGYVAALTGLIRAINALIHKHRPAPEPKTGLMSRLSQLFAYTPAAPDLHLVETKDDYYAGCLPQNLETSVKLEDIHPRDLAALPAYPFSPFSYQDPNKTAETLLINSWGDADAKLLSDFTGLKLSKEFNWYITDQQGMRQELNWGNNYRSVLKGINAITKDTGARLHLQAYPWEKDLVFFINRKEEEAYKSIYPSKSANLRETSNKQLRLELTEAYTRLNPGDIDALAELSTYYGEQKNHKKVLELTKKHLQIAPHHYVLQNNQLIAYVHLQRYPEAIEAGLLALELKPDSTQTHYFLGVAYTWLDEFEKAAAVLEFSIRNAPQEPFHWFAYAYLFYRQGDYEQAIKNYRETIKTSVEFRSKQSCRSSAWFNMACIHSLQNQIEASRTAFIEALKLSPEYRNDLLEDKELDNLRKAVDAEAMYKEAGL